MKIKIILILTLFQFLSINLVAQFQVGSDIVGEAIDDQSGESVSISDDGTILAIGAPYNDDAGTDAGHVRVFEWNATDSAWEQMRSDINGEASGDESGTSVSLSSDGTRLAIGAPYNDGNVSGINLYPNPTSGKVQITFDGYYQEDVFSLKVVDHFGRELMEVEIDDVKVELDLSMYAEGIYFIVLDNGESIRLMLR